MGTTTRALAAIAPRMHTIEFSVLYAPHPLCGQVFVRLPRTYGTRLPPTSDDVMAALLPFCDNVHLDVYQADNAGGFQILLQGDMNDINNAACGMVQFLGGKANLAGESSVTEIMPIHESVAGAVIGKQGSNLRDLKCASGAHIDVSPFHGPSATRQVQLIGTVEAVQYARRLVLDSVQSKVASMQLSGSPSQPAYPMMINTMDYAGYPQVVPWIAQPHTYFDSSSSWGPGLPTNLESAAPAPIFEQAPAAEQTLALVQPSQPAAIAGIKLVRQVSSRILVHLPHAAWCLLKDRVAMMAEFRLAVSRMYDVIQQQDRAENYGIKFGKRTRSWAHFVLERPEPAEAAVNDKVQKPCNSFRLQRASSAVSLASREPQQVAVPVC